LHNMLYMLYIIYVYYIFIYYYYIYYVISHTDCVWNIICEISTYTLPAVYIIDISTTISDNSWVPLPLS